MSKSPHILVIRLSALGDLIQSSRHIMGFRRHWPSAHVTLLSEPMGAALFADGQLGVVDEVIAWRRKVSWREDWRALSQIRQRRFDYAFDLHSKVQTGIALSLSGAGRKGRIVAGPLVKALMGAHVPRAKTASGMLRQAGVKLDAAAAVQIDAAPPELRPNEKLRAQAKDILTGAGLTAEQSFVILAPGSSAGWPSKRWPALAFAELAKELGTRGLCSVVVGAAEERDLGQQISAAAPGVIDLTGRTSLAVLVAVLGLAKLAVTNDSGPMHIAGVMNIPTLALFGPTDPARHGPDHFYGSRHATLSAQVPCSPCYAGHCPLPEQICMRDISVAQALGAVLPMLKTAG